LARDGPTNDASATFRTCAGKLVCSHADAVLMPLEHRSCVTACPVGLCPGASPPDDPTRVFHRYEAAWPCVLSGLRSCSPVRSRAQATRAILFATATQALFIPTRTTSCRIHRLVTSVFVRARLTTDHAPCMSRHRRSLLPRFEIPAKCSGPQTAVPKPANKGSFRLTFDANRRAWALSQFFVCRRCEGSRLCRRGD
jgi:hypothetical protein